LMIIDDHLLQTAGWAHRARWCRLRQGNVNKGTRGMASYLAPICGSVIASADASGAADWQRASVLTGGLIGSRTVNRDPAPSLLSTSMVPPCRSTTILTR